MQFFYILFSSTELSARTVHVFLDRGLFTLGTGISITDDYENPSYNYQRGMTDSEMSAVLNETSYFTYGGNITNYNNIMVGFGVEGSNAYCSLCYGSFKLSFDNTSLTNAGGVYGVGLDITNNSGYVSPYKYSATVRFAGNQISSFELPYVLSAYPANPLHQFWGITSDEAIHSIDFISYSSDATLEQTFLIIDNLTIAASPVPVPTAAFLMLTGLGIVGWINGRRRTNI